MQKDAQNVGLFYFSSKTFYRNKYIRLCVLAPTFVVQDRGSNSDLISYECISMIYQMEREAQLLDLWEI